MFTDSSSGPMAMTNEAKKLQEDRVYDDTVVYYDTVCSGIGDIDSTSRKVLDISETSIGQDDAKTKKDYIVSLDRLLDTTQRIKSDLSHINSEVKNVEIGNNTHVVYQGALDNTIRILDTAVADVEKQKRDIASLDVKETDKVNDAYSHALSTIADNNGKITGSLGDVFKKASVLSKPTIEIVKTSTSCAPIIGGPLSDEKYKDTTVDGVVDLKKRLYDSYDKMTKATFLLSQLGQFSGGHDNNSAGLIVKNLDEAEKNAYMASSTVKNWHNLYPHDDPQWEVSHDHEAIRDKTYSAYKGLGDEIKKLKDDINAHGRDDVENLGDIYKSHSKDLKQAQINAYRAHARGNLDFSPATQPTADAISHLQDPSQEKVDDKKVKEYLQIVKEKRSIVDASQKFSDDSQRLEGTDIDTAVSILTSGISGVADSVQENTKGLSEKDIHKVKSLAEDLREQAQVLGTLGHAEVNNRLSEILDSVSESQRSIFDIYSNFLCSYDTGNLPTRQKIESEARDLER